MPSRTASGSWLERLRVERRRRVARHPLAERRPSAKTSCRFSVRRVVKIVPNTATPSAAPDLAEVVVRARRGADLDGGDGVLHDEHDDLHDQAEAGAEDEQEHADQPDRGGGGERRHRDHRDAGDERADDREHLVAAGLRDRDARDDRGADQARPSSGSSAGRMRRPRCPTTSAGTSGTKPIAANMPRPRVRPIAVALTKIGLRNRLSGMIGSFARASARTKRGDGDEQADAAGPGLEASPSRSPCRRRSR